MGILKKPLDYTRRCDKCDNWIPSHVTVDFEGCKEGGGGYCCLVQSEMMGYKSSDVGYSKLAKKVIYEIMNAFVMDDKVFYDREYNSQVLITMANFCPLFDEISLEEMKKRNKQYGCELNPYLTMHGIKEA